VPAVAEQTQDVLRRYVERLLAQGRNPTTGLFTMGSLGTYDGSRTIDQAAVVQILAMPRGT
jgi:hypothetical protein